tara:strand:- start:245 stop:496 length:252 start_codon:yes stop_codon:yes gene_type:complete
MNELKTPGGKTLDTYICPQTAHVKIKLVEGGVVPEVLSGIYTSHSLANSAIQTYLLVNAEKQTEKEKVKKEKKEFIKSLSKEK